MIPGVGHLRFVWIVSYYDYILITCLMFILFYVNPIRCVKSLWYFLIEKLLI